MPKITIDVDMSYKDYFLRPDESVVIEDVEDEGVAEEIAITCPTCGAVMVEEVEAD
jgi:hypothetical protein|tara:strand:- start:194 stop:361 length:168 start_codon:yes stop_codon:yes gene_type:complete